MNWKQIWKKKALLVPVEHNPDIEAIEDTIKNIDAEIESLFDDEAMVMEKKIQFITEHIKKVVVIEMCLLCWIVWLERFCF